MAWVVIDEDDYPDVLDNIEWYKEMEEKIDVKNKEINRLNIIIKELEKSWKEQQEHYRYIKDNRYRTFLSKNLNKIYELKGKE